MVAMVFDVGAGPVENAIDLQQYVLQVFVDLPGLGFNTGGGNQENRNIETGTLDRVQGTGQYIGNRDHRNPDIGEVGVVEQDHFPGIFETFLRAFAGGNLQGFHRGVSWRALNCPQLL
ncbi:hypothetical protein D3C81_1716510 [compost metagenome]